ncbi:MAG: TIGR02710 family CRISPR-associated CARF protein [Leptospiraceae bacterium]|nr:TIGR02710 family CRISPR-associated CARF protein [Leptospiraceae bacterium]
MKKAMIVTVGTGSGVEHGILYSIKSHNPNLLMLIYSEGSTQTLNSILNDLEKLKFPTDKILKKQYDEVNDVELLYKTYSEYLKEIISKGFSTSEIVADYTSGTKAMSAALCLAAVSLNVNTLSYVYGERDQNGKVRSGTERVYSLSPNVIFIEEKLKFFRLLFNKYQFESAFDLIQNLKHPDFDSTLEIYKTLALGYSKWDKFDYKGAFDQLKSLKENQLEKNLKDTLDKHKEILFKLQDSQLKEENLNDLYSNAKRRFEEGKYDDCVSRLYRLLEMIAQKEIEKELELETKSIPYEELPANLKEKHKNSVQDGNVKLSLQESFEFLLSKQPENQVAKNYKQDSEEFKKLLSMRNDSLLAHGFVPIDKRKAKEMLDLIQKIKDFKEISFWKFS